MTTFYISCLLNSRSKIDSYGELKLLEIFKKSTTSEDRVKLHNKILAEHVDLCVRYANTNREYVP